MAGSNERTLESWLKIIGIAIALGSFIFGGLEYLDARKMEIETRRIEAAKPFLDLQLKLYKDATQAAARISTSSDKESGKELKRFWELYWGELALIENLGVDIAMRAFGKGLNDRLSTSDMEQLSLNLAHACRESLAFSWGVDLWESHYSNLIDTNQDTLSSKEKINQGHKNEKRNNP